MTEKLTDLLGDFVQLARLGMSGRPQDVSMFTQKAARRYRAVFPELSEKLTALLREAPSRSSPLRRETALPLPLDADSRLKLIRIEEPGSQESWPILGPEVADSISQIIEERRNLDRLLQAGMTPTRTALFVGPPGVGKTMTARYIAAQLAKRLLVLDLSAVMSSFLGRTGNNIRAVMDYAKSMDCILFLDELDAVAKRRDDTTEVGELKRLVTVILQEVDDWPSEGLLIAATNHPDLLDPAIWRRFDMVVDFPKPNEQERRSAIERFLGADKEHARDWIDILTTLFEEDSFSDIEKNLARTRRRTVVMGGILEEEIAKSLARQVDSLPRQKRVEFANALTKISSMSQRKISDLTGISRDALRKNKPPNISRKETV